MVKDAIELLTEDHKRIIALLTELEASTALPTQTRSDLLDEIETALLVLRICPQYSQVVLAVGIAHGEISDQERIFVVFPDETDISSAGDLECPFWKCREFSCKWLSTSHNALSAPLFRARKRESDGRTCCKGIAGI